MLLVLAAGKPFAHAGKAPHGTAVALLAFPFVGLLAVLDELDVSDSLHAPYARLQLLKEEKNGRHRVVSVIALQRLLKNQLQASTGGT